MCIRDRVDPELGAIFDPLGNATHTTLQWPLVGEDVLITGCLLYTSDAADERSSVDLGGRRIIKKKNTDDCTGTPHYYK